MASRRRELSTSIPPEIITEILHRLPAKSIGRFRCVSKAWLSQLTHPSFIKNHLNNNTSSHQNHLILRTSDIEGRSMFLHSHPFHPRKIVTSPTKFDLQLPYNTYCVNVYGSCDGLVLFRALDTDERMVVINPTTKECLHLPEQRIHDVYDTNNNEYEHESSLYGFGYDSVTDDYKVVSLTQYVYVNEDDGDHTDKVYADVYSFRNKKWRRVTDCRYGYATSYGVFFNGYIHWVVFTGDGDLQGIAAFSLADECFSNILLPVFCNVNGTLKGYNYELLVLGGKLAIFIKSEGVVWLMDEYGVTESWTKILLHGINKVPLFNPNRISDPSVFDDNGKLLVASDDRMMVYEVEKATFTETVCVWDPEIFSIAGFYGESLVSPKQGKEEEGKNDNAEDENEEGVSESEADDDAEDKNEKNDEKVESEAEDENEKDDDKVESEEDDSGEDESEESDEDTSEGIRADIEFSEEDDDNDKNEEDESKEDDANDLRKAKHQEEKLRADRLEEELTHALSKIQALERRTMEQDDEIESLKARVQ